MAVVFDSVGFSAELDSLKKKVSDKLKAQLKTVATEEAQSQLDDKSPNDAQAYTRFCDKITVRNGVKKVDKSIIPEDVYKAIMLEAAVRDKTISKGFDIGNLDGNTVSAFASWFQGIFGETTTTVKVGEKNYTVTMRDNYSAQVKFPSGNTYSVTWTLDDTAKNALKAYIADLKDYLVDYRYQIYGAIVKDGMSSLIREFVTEIAEGVDSAKEKLITGFHDWALNNITETGVDVAINKILPKTYEQIKNVEKNYKTFINKCNDLKTYAKKVTDDSIKTNKKYTAFVTAYNNLDTGDQIDGLIDKYLRYSFSDVTRDEITESNAKISGTSDADSIKTTGSKDTVTSGKGNDTIIADSYSKIDGGAGDDEIDNQYSHYVTIRAGVGNDTVWNHEDNVTINAGTGDDYIKNYAPEVSISGSAGNDFIHNYGDSVKVNGGDGNDSINNGGANAIIDGGNGNDTIINNGSNVVFNYSLGESNDIIYGFKSDSTLSITGGSYFTTKSGSDIIVTVGEGKISLIGAAELNKVNINGATVDEWLTLTNKNKSFVKLSSKIKVADASARTAAVAITGNALANTISGGSKNDSIYGNAGNDSLVGNAGNDKLVGGKGNDSLWGGKGNDSLWGDSGADTFFYYKGDDKDVIFGFDNKDTLTLDGLDFSASYSKKTGTLTFKVDGGSIILKDLGTTTTFHINNDIYKISGSKLIKK